MDNDTKKDILNTLAELAGKNLSEDQIERHDGTKISLPKGLSTARAIKGLQEYQQSEEAVVEVIHRFNYRPLDGIVALKRVLRQVTGFVQSAKTIESVFFGSYTPPTINVQTSVDEWEQAPTGEFPLEVFEGTVEVGTWQHDTFGTLFSVQVNAPRKYQAAVSGFISMLQTELETNSIYRGKAITAEATPSFLDLRGVSPEKVVYSEDVLTQLDANIWSLIEHTQAMRDNSLPLKRAVLLEGPYGTGKTLAAYLTAQKAVANDWTFIFVRPGKDNLNEAMATAQLYQPSVVFFEDIDIEAGTDHSVSLLLDVFDGIQAKGTEIVAVLTTNHADRIHKGLVRPGRLDAVLHIGELDWTGIEKLIRVSVDPRWLPEELDIELIAPEMEGFMPAFVKEAIDRAVRYSIARNEGRPTQLTSTDFADAARGLRPQLELMNGANERNEREPTLRELVRTELNRTQLVYEPGGDPYGVGLRATS